LHFYPPHDHLDGSFGVFEEPINVFVIQLCWWIIGSSRIWHRGDIYLSMLPSSSSSLSSSSSSWITEHIWSECPLQKCTCRCKNRPINKCIYQHCIMGSIILMWHTALCESSFPHNWLVHWTN
jgi:hypothetical protein